MERAKYTGEAAARAELETPQSKPGWLENQHSLPFKFVSPDEFEIFGSSVPVMPKSNMENL